LPDFRCRIAPQFAFRNLGGQTAENVAVVLRVLGLAHQFVAAALLQAMTYKKAGVESLQQAAVSVFDC
jgi:hypothetical protein